MQVIGIVGGVSSGKSLVSEIFAELGAAVVSGDRAGHAVLGERDVVAAVSERWGPGVLTKDGQIDRRRLANIVFHDASGAELSFLEDLTHPRIAKHLRESIQQHAERGVSAVILDAAILLKTGWDQMCDKIVFIETPLENRRARALQKGWDENELARREANQLPLAEKRSRADWILDNSGTVEELRSRIRSFWDSQFESQMPN